MARGLRRSLLYVPGSSERMLRKATARGADVLILDLEDGVHPDAKVEARERVTSAFGNLDFAKSDVFLRVNPLDSPWGRADLELAAALCPRGVVLPKVTAPSLVQRVDEVLPSEVALYLMIESAEGVLEAGALARCSTRVKGLMFGAADYRASLRAGRDPQEMELFFARSHILHAARAAGIEVFDTPWFDVEDTEGLRESAQRVRRMGFDGKTAIHPRQVPVINAVFAPTGEEVARAQRIVDALKEAFDDRRTVAVVDGEMVEALHLREAERILERARRAGLIS